MSSAPGRFVATRLAIPVTIIGFASFVASLAFGSLFIDWRFVTAAAIGALGATAVGFMAVWRRLLVGESLAISIAAFVLIGVPATAHSVSVDAIATFFSGLTGGWIDVLSVSPPLTTTPALTVLPYTTAWLGALIGIELSRAVRLPGVGAAGPVTALGVALLLSPENPDLSLIPGAALTASAILLGLVQQRQLADTEDHLTTGTLHRRKIKGLASSGVLLILVAALAPLLAPRLPLAGSRDRFDLREIAEPPWNPLDVPSPLVQIKSSLKDDKRTDEVFTITGDVPITRWPVAVLSAYDGTIWEVASDGEAAAGAFLSVDQTFPKPITANELAADQMQHRIVLHQKTKPFLAMPGWPIVMTFEEDGVEQAADVRFDSATGTTAIPTGLNAGMSYTVVSQRQHEPAEFELRRATIQLDTTIDLDSIPSNNIKTYTADLIDGQQAGWPQIQAISEAFRADGFYDYSESARPGHSYFRIDEFLADPKQIVGYEEQYAGTAAVLARVAQVPTRAVVGYHITEDRYQGGSATVLAEDIAAWIEVRTDEWGWVPVDVTPDRSREPSDDEKGITTKKIAIPNPPPPPPPLPETASPQLPEDEPEEEEETDEPGNGTAILRWVGMGVAATSPAWIGAGVAAAIVMAKTRRTKSRRAGRPAKRILGAWQELLERCREAGAVLPTRATPNDVAQTLLDNEALPIDTQPALFTLAGEVDRAAFCPDAPSDADADRAWQLCEGALAGLYQASDRRQRLRMRYDPRPLTRRDPVVVTSGSKGM